MDVAEVRGVDVVEVDVVHDVVADVGDVLLGVVAVHQLAHDIGSVVEGFLVEGGSVLGGAVVDAQGGDDVGGHVGLARRLRDVGVDVAGGRASCAFVGGDVDLGVVGEGDVFFAVGVEFHLEVAVVVHNNLEFLDGALALQGEGFVQEVVAAMDGVVDHDGASQFHAGVHHGQFAQVVEAAAVGALGGQLVDEGVLRHVDACAVELEGVDLVDGEVFEVRIVDHEGLALVGVGGEGAVAEDLHLVAVVVVAGAVGVDGPFVAQQFVDGVGLLGVGQAEQGDEGDYK